MPTTASNHYFTRFFQLAADCGLNADALLARADIDRGIIDVPGRREDAEKLATMIVAIWDALQDESMSLAGSRIPRGSFYMMGRLTVHEASLKKALEQYVRFYSMVTQAFTTCLSTEGDKAVLTFEMNYPEMDSDHLLAEIHLMAIHRYASWLIAENITLNEVYFSYPTPPHIKEYAFLFPGKHVFDAPYMGFSFGRKYLDYENVQTAGTLKIFMRRCPLELFLQPTTDFSLTSEVRALLFPKIQAGFPSIVEVADYLHMTRRTVMRKLKQEGSSYQQIKDIVRRDKAIYLLTDQSLAMNEIAEKVGFSDAAVFARAFKSWTGLSPREYRTRNSRPAPKRA